MCKATSDGEAYWYFIETYNSITATSYNKRNLKNHSAHAVSRRGASAQTCLILKTSCRAKSNHCNHRQLSSKTAASLQWCSQLQNNYQVKGRWCGLCDTHVCPCLNIFTCVYTDKNTFKLIFKQRFKKSVTQSGVQKVLNTVLTGAETVSGHADLRTGRNWYNLYLYKATAFCPLYVCLDN